MVIALSLITATAMVLVLISYCYCHRACRKKRKDDFPAKSEGILNIVPCHVMFNICIA
jgi:hypothetical protein